jgi:hypothetical protein
MKQACLQEKPIYKGLVALLRVRRGHQTFQKNEPKGYDASRSGTTFPPTDSSPTIRRISASSATRAVWLPAIVMVKPDKDWPHGKLAVPLDRRECLDHTVVFGEGHMRRILAAYTGYYNECRTHLSLDKDTPDHRPIHRLGQLVAQPILGGFHHQYCRI